MERKQNLSGFFLAVLIVGGIISGCSLYKKNGPAAPDFSKPTATFTPTLTGIYTNTYTSTSTITATPTITSTPTITATPTITNTHVSATDTVTYTPTMTFTQTMTSTATATATGCTQGALASVYTFDNTLECWTAKEGYGEVTGTILSITNVSPAVGTGCMAAYAPVTVKNQFIQLQNAFLNPPDLTNKAFRCRVKASPEVGTGTCTAHFFTQNGSWNWEQSGDFSFTSADGWVTIGWTPPFAGGSTVISCIGVQLYSNSASNPSPGNFYLDEFEVYDLVPVTPTNTPVPGAAQGWTFDSNIAGWATDSTDSSASVFSGSVAAWDGAVGSAAAGSVSLYVPFSTTSEKILLADSFASVPIDMSGKTITAKVRLDWAGTCAGADLANSPMLAQIIVKTGSGWVYADGANVSLTSTGTWFTLTMSANSPNSSNPGYAPVSVIQAAVKVQTGSAGTYCPVVIHVDDWQYQ